MPILHRKHLDLDAYPQLQKGLACNCPGSCCDLWDDP